jgi:hypothetical protein
MKAQTDDVTIATLFTDLSDILRTSVLSKLPSTRFTKQKMRSFEVKRLIDEIKRLTPEMEDDDVDTNTIAELHDSIKSLESQLKHVTNDVLIKNAAEVLKNGKEALEKVQEVVSRRAKEVESINMDEEEA